jgi:hypothetical protein
MTVFSKIVVVKVKNAKMPTLEINEYQIKNNIKLGIDVVPLRIAPGIGEATLKFVCSDNNPTTPRNMDHIDALLSELNVLAELKTHPNDPVSTGKVNHDLQITSNLEDPNIEDRHIKNAKRVHKEHISKEQIDYLNKKVHRFNKQLSDTSTANSEKLKPFPEDKDEVDVGEIERG